MNEPLLYSILNNPSEALYFIEDDTIYLDVIKTPIEYRNCGYANKLLESFIQEFSVDMDITLLATDLMHSDLDRLVKWYERHGFEVFNRNKHYVDMILEG